MEIIINPAETYTPGDTADVRDVDAWFDRPGDFGAPGTVRLTQYDTHPIIAVHMYYGHEPYALPDGGGVNIRQKKTDGEPVYNPALGVSEDKTIAYFQVTKQMSVAPGLSKAVVEVVIDGKTAGTAIFILNIDKNPVQDDDVESTGEYKTLQDYVNDARGSAGSASDSAADALRSKNDADKAKTAAESAKTAAENAKTAAESAKTSAESARTGAQNAESAARELKEQAEVAADNAKENATSAAADALRAEEAAERAQQITQGALGYYETPEILNSRHPSADAGNWAIVGSTDTIWVWDTEKPGWTDSGAGQVTSVNGQTGVVDLSAADVSALPLAGGTVTGTVILSKTTDANGTSDARPALIVGGPPTGSHLELDGNELMAKSNATTPTDLHLNGQGGVVHIGPGGLDCSVFSANAIKALFLAAHPVGSYYWSSNATSPASLFGGTWTQIKDRFVLAAGDTYKVGQTGGAASVTSGGTGLTAAQNGPHNHGISWEYNENGQEILPAGTPGATWLTDGVRRSYVCVPTSSGSGSPHTHSVATMPPYIVAYCWQRTA